MAQAFNLTAQLNLRGPSNIRQVVSDIKKQLGTINADVKFNIDQSSINNTSKLSKSLQDLNKNLSNVAGNARAASDAIKGFGQSINNISGSSSKLSANINKTIKSSNNLGQSVAKTAKNIGVAKTEMEEFGRQGALAIRRFAAFSAVTTVFFSLNRAINIGLKSFIEFDRQLVRLQQVTGRTADGVRNIQDEITKLSINLGVSSDKLIAVSTTLAQAGLSANETRIALEALAKSELAPSFDDLNKTVEGSIALIRQFGIASKDLEKALGSINAVAARFAVESGDIIAAIQRAGGVFASASKGVSEGTDALNEFIAVFTSVRATTRESAETIATGLRTIFTRIQRGDTIEALREFGVTLTDTEGKFVGAYKAIELLSQGLSRIDPRDLRFSQIVEELGGFRQIGKVIPLIQQFATAQEALKAAQGGQDSLTSDAIKAQLSLANQISKVREEFLSLIRGLGQSDTFQTLAKGALGFASGLIKISSALKGVLPALAILSAGASLRALTQFTAGFAGGLKKVPKNEEGEQQSVARSIGSNIGTTLVGAKTEQVSRDLDQNSAALDKISGKLDSFGSSIGTLDSSINNLNNNFTIINSAILSYNSLLQQSISSLATNTSSLDNLTNAINNLNLGGGPTTARDGGKILGFNKGGVVPGSGKGDKVPALLEPGEVVMNNRAAQKYGRGNLVRMNKYTGGGSVNVTASELLSRSKGSKAVKEFITDNEESNTYTSGRAINTLDNISFNRRIYKLYDEDSVNDWSGFEDAVVKKTGGTRTNFSKNDPSFPIDITNSNYGPLEVRNRLESTSNRTLLDKLIRYYITEKQFSRFKNQPSPDNIQLGNIGVVYNSAKYDPPNAKELSFGGKIQRFMSGGVAELARTKGKSIEEILLEQIKALGGPAGVKRIIGVSEGDRSFSSLLNGNNIKAGKNIDRATKVVNEALDKAGTVDAIETKRIAELKNVAVAGLMPMGYSNTFEWDIGNDRSILASVKGFSNKYIGVVEQMQQEANDISTRFAENLQYAEIFGGTEKLAFDFDDTLISGADILDESGKPDIFQYNNREAVQKALRKGRLTRLGQKLKSIIDIDPNFIKQTRILTARPQSTADLLSDTLNRFGLQYSPSDITGISTGLETDIPTGKASNLTDSEKLIDDSLANINAAKKIGKKGFLYSEPKTATSEFSEKFGQGNIEGAILEKTIAQLLGYNLDIDQLESNRAIDFPEGLGSAAQFFDLNPNVPTEIKRTLNNDSFARAREEFGRYYDENPDKFKFNSGGLVQSFKEGSTGGVKDRSTKNLVRGARGDNIVWKGMKVPLSYEDIMGLSTEDMIAYGRSQEFDDYVFSGGAGIATKKLIKLPDGLTQEEIEAFGSDIIKKADGYYSEIEEIFKFRKATKLTSPTSAMREARSKAAVDAEQGNRFYTQAEDAISDFKKTGKLSPFDPAIDSHIKTSFPNYISELESLLKTETDPDEKNSIQRKLKKAQVGWPDYQALLSGTPVPNKGRITGLSETLNSLLESYGGPVGSKEIDSIISALGSKLMKKNIGGIIQSFKKGGKPSRYVDWESGVGPSPFDEPSAPKLDYYSILENSGLNLKSWMIDSLADRARTNRWTEEQIIAEASRSQASSQQNLSSTMDRESLLSSLGARPEVSEKQRKLAQSLIGPVDARYDPKYDKARSKFAIGGPAEDKKQKDFGKIGLRSSGSEITATYFKNNNREGFVSAKKAENSLYTIGLSKATKGYGPRLYDIVMEAATSAGGMLTSDRSAVSDSARAVWAYYFKNRGDVKKTPLDPSQWTKNQSFIDPKLYGKKETWPPFTDEAWILQSGYSKSPDLINGSDVVDMNDPKYASYLRQQQLSFINRRGGGSNFGGDVPARVSNGEAYVPPKTAQRIGYGTLNRMNQADRNGMGRFRDGGISVFKGPGSGTSDSIPTNLPVGSFIIREKATKALGLNKGGGVGVRKFFKGGQNKKDAVRAQGQILNDIDEASVEFYKIIESLGKEIKSSILNKFKGIRELKSDDIIGKQGQTAEGTRGVANIRGDSSRLGFQIKGKKAQATTETVAHETGHLADASLGEGKAFASETKGTFQFDIIEKIKPQMIAAFQAAGKSSDEINTYLARNRELFAEFFAKASPEVRNILTSTKDSAEGMRLMHEHLKSVSHTYAGLEAADFEREPSQTTRKTASGKDTVLSSLGASASPDKFTAAIDKATFGLLDFASVKLRDLILGTSSLQESGKALEYIYKSFGTNLSDKGRELVNSIEANNEANQRGSRQQELLTDGIAERLSQLNAQGATDAEFLSAVNDYIMVLNEDTQKKGGKIPAITGTSIPPPGKPPVPPSTSSSGGGSRSGPGDFEARVQKLLMEFEDLGKATKIRVLAEQNAAGESAKNALETAKTATAMAIAESSAQKLAQGIDPNIVNEALERIKTDSSILQLSSEELKSTRDPASCLPICGQGNNGSSSSGSTSPGSSGSDDTKETAESAVKAADELKLLALLASQSGVSLKVFKQNLEKQLGSAFINLKNEIPKLIQSVRANVAQNRDKLTSSDDQVREDATKSLAEDIRRSIGSSNISGISDKQIDKFISDLQDKLKNTSIGFDEAISSVSGLSEALTNASSEAQLQARAVEAVSTSSGLAVNTLNSMAASAVKAAKSLEASKILNTQLVKLSLAIGSAGSAIGFALKEFGGSQNANSVVAGAVVGSVTQTASAGMSLASQTNDPKLKGLILVGTAAAAAAGAFKDAKNALRDFNLEMSSKKLEQSISRVSDLFDRFSKDTTNLDILKNIDNELERGSRSLITNLETDLKVPKTFWANIFDQKGPGASERSMILEKEGIMSYGKSLIGGSSYTDMAMQRLAPEKALETAKKAQPQGQNILQQFENKLASGASMDEILSDLKKEGNETAQILARMNPEINKQIMLIQSDSSLGEPRKRALIQDTVATEALRVAKINLKNKIKQIELDKLARETNNFAASLERMFNNMEQAINRAGFELDKLSRSADLSAAALSGNAKAGNVMLDNINILQNPRAYSSEQQNAAYDQAAGMFGSQAGLIRPLLGLGDKLESTVMKTINRSVKENPTSTTEGIAGNIRVALDKQLKGLGLPSNIADKIAVQTREAFVKIRSKGDDVKLNFDQVVEEVPAFAKAISSAQRAQELANKAMEFYQKNVNEYAQAMNQMVDYQIEANNRMRKATQIQAKGNMELSRALGKRITLDESRKVAQAPIKSMTGGLTDARDIGRNVVNLENTRRNQQASADAAANRGPSGKDEFALMQNRLRGTNTALRENIDALKQMADSTELAQAALQKIQEVQAKRQAGVNLIEKMVTSNPEELAKLNASIGRLNNNMRGGLNIGSTSEQRAETLQTFNMLAPLLGDGQKQNELKANVLESMLKESGMGIDSTMQDVLNSLRDPEGDPQMAEAISVYRESLNQQTEANRVLGELQNMMAANTAEIAATKLATAIGSVKLNFEQQVFNDIRDGIQQLVKIAQNGQNPIPVTNRNRGGIIYASTGKAIDFTPKGTDTVPAMLTPGEFVVNRSATQKNLPLLKSINNGYSNGGKVKYYSSGGFVDIGGKFRRDDRLEDSDGKQTNIKTDKNKTKTTERQTKEELLSFEVLSKNNPDLIDLYGVKRKYYASPKGDGVLPFAGGDFPAWEPALGSSYGDLMFEQSIKSDLATAGAGALAGAAAVTAKRVATNKSTETLTKAAVKTAVKTGLLKKFLKLVPGAGIVLGGIEIAKGAIAGDFGKVGLGILETVGGAASLFPGVGTAVSLAIDGALILGSAAAAASAKDIYMETLAKPKIEYSNTIGTANNLSPDPLGKMLSPEYLDSIIEDSGGIKQDKKEKINQSAIEAYLESLKKYREFIAANTIANNIDINDKPPSWNPKVNINDQGPIEKVKSGDINELTGTLNQVSKIKLSDLTKEEAGYSALLGIPDKNNINEVLTGSTPSSPFGFYYPNTLGRILGSWGSSDGLQLAGGSGIKTPRNPGEFTRSLQGIKEKAAGAKGYSLDGTKQYSESHKNLIKMIDDTIKDIPKIQFEETADSSSNKKEISEIEALYNKQIFKASLGSNKIKIPSGAEEPLTLFNIEPNDWKKQYKEYADANDKDIGKTFSFQENDFIPLIKMDGDNKERLIPWIANNFNPESAPDVMAQALAFDSVASKFFKISASAEESGKYKFLYSDIEGPYLDNTSKNLNDSPSQRYGIIQPGGDPSINPFAKLDRPVFFKGEKSNLLKILDESIPDDDVKKTNLENISPYTISLDGIDAGLLRPLSSLESYDDFIKGEIFNALSEVEKASLVISSGGKPTLDKIDFTIPEYTEARKKRIEAKQLEDAKTRTEKAAGERFEELSPTEEAFNNATRLSIAQDVKKAADPELINLGIGSTPSLTKIEDVGGVASYLNSYLKKVDNKSVRYAEINAWRALFSELYKPDDPEASVRYLKGLGIDVQGGKADAGKIKSIISREKAIAISQNADGAIDSEDLEGLKLESDKTKLYTVDPKTGKKTEISPENVKNPKTVQDVEKIALVPENMFENAEKRQSYLKVLENYFTKNDLPDFSGAVGEIKTWYEAQDSLLNTSLNNEDLNRSLQDLDTKENKAKIIEQKSTYDPANELLTGGRYGELPDVDRMKDLIKVRSSEAKEEKKQEQAARLATGGLVYASTGKLINFQPRGTDTVPAMLTPGEFVVNRSSTQKYKPVLEAINNGNYSRGGIVNYLSKGGHLPIYRSEGGSASGGSFDFTKFLNNMVGQITSSISQAFDKAVSNLKPANNASGGVSNSGEDIKSIDNFVNRLNNIANILSNIYIPPQITITGKHDLVVTINGDTVLNQLEPDMAGIAVAAIKRAFEDLKKKNPENNTINFDIDF
jgi:ABC-type transporter Mla subunit MlaD